MTETDDDDDDDDDGDFLGLKSVNMSKYQWRNADSPTEISGKTMRGAEDKTKK